MNPSNYVEFTDTFLDIIYKLNEKEIEILEYFNQIDDPNKRVKNDMFDINEDKYNFYIQDLISKCLLIDDSINRVGTRPLTIIKITKFGEDFLEYIKES